MTNGNGRRHTSLLPILVAIVSVTSAFAANLIRPASGFSNAIPPLGLPSLPYASLDARKVELGRLLFFDRRLSFNHTMSCAMCHIPTDAFASTQSATAIGMEGQSLTRNAPTLLNVVYQKTLFLDGRETSLVSQPWSPLLSSVEMANPSVGFAIDNIRGLANYEALFKTAFGDRGLDMETVGEAIAEYERSLLSGNSRFDRWKYGGDQAALTEEQKRGFRLFTGKAGCSGCHLVGDQSALFTDNKFHATGVGYKASVFAPPPAYNVELEAGKITKVEDDDLRSVSERKHNDVGRFAVTLDPKDRWAYKTPSLRNVALTFPYMHDGSLKTLAEVIDFYNAGGIDFDNKSPLLHPLGLSDQDKSDLVAFLQSLTGDHPAELEPPTGSCLHPTAKESTIARDPQC
ncbi:MAG: c-type cytochrome [Proteobacteria bacterium]|nr:c-type cytochrome [Pseudomonadota bacterium]